MNSSTYCVKKNINWACELGIPYSFHTCARLTGRGSCIQCLSTMFIDSFTRVPMKNTI